TQTVNVNETKWFTWTYSTTGAGSIAVNSFVTGYAQYSKVTVTSDPTSSNYIDVVAPATLISSITAPSVANINDTFTVYMVVTNTGTADANNVMPSLLQQIGTGGAVLAAPTPSAQNIPGGAGRTFTFVYQAAGTGTVVFRGNASGTDEHSLRTVSSSPTDSNVLTINTAAQLNVSMAISQGDTVGTGDFITLIMSVTNTGTTAANNVAPKALLIDGAANVNHISGPLPATVPSLSGGAATRFTWTYQALTSGNVTFTGSASGIDSVNGMPVTITPVSVSDSVFIENAASLNVTSFVVQPSQLSINQSFTVLMTVSSTGTGTADNVTPGSLYKYGSANVSYVAGPDPASVATLTPDATQTFTWIYTATSAGTLWFSNNATGYDSTRMKGIATDAVWSNTVTVQAGVSLTSGIIMRPSQASVGQVITVIMAVTNNGGAVAESAYGVTVVPTGTGSATWAGIWPATVDIAGGSSAHFTWTFIATAAGATNFTGEVRAYDFNTNAKYCTSDQMY
ncbi:MAG TPA: hypothetical protein PLF61_05110, partial [Candidatus Goldiibacteriota bacterium]|nr:hypothetical protein [Candidatus Goldiibacteriota bacterium]